MSLMTRVAGICLWLLAAQQSSPPIYAAEADTYLELSEASHARSSSIAFPLLVNERIPKIGDVVSEDVVLKLIPRFESYRYAVVKDRRVVVDTGTRRIIYVID